MSKKERIAFWIIVGFMIAVLVLGISIFISGIVLGWGAFVTLSTFVLVLVTAGGVGFMFWDKHQLFEYAQRYITSYEIEDLEESYREEENEEFLENEQETE